MTPDDFAGNFKLPSRRRWLTAGIAVAAGTAGLGTAWWQLQARAQAPAKGAADGELWKLKFDAPSGPALDMTRFQGKPLLVNFWATWCPPCIEELPLIDAFYRENRSKGWQVIGLAADQPNAVRQFLAKKPLGFPIGIIGLKGIELSKSLGNLTGGLPYSVAFSADGNVAQRKIGKLSEADLARWSDIK
ncbi:MAG: redoxin family protein [Burkholderiaceae bacterium]